jgi:predicted transcriptional regulator
VKLVSIKLPLELAEEIDAMARRRKLSRSDVIREAMAEYVVRSESSSRLSALALAGDLAGSLEGPEDLATNPVYLEGFGE